MNADQRKFLVARVEKTYQQQVNQIREGNLSKEPSLNNYLVAACLDDSIEFLDIDKIKAKIKDKVLSFGAGDAIIKEDHNYRTSTYSKTVTLRAEDLFVIPEAYKKALSEYQMGQAKIREKINELEASKDTILLKINTGSNQVLDKLITQVDNLADLNIMNSQFLLQ